MKKISTFIIVLLLVGFIPKAGGNNNQKLKLPALSSQSIFVQVVSLPKADILEVGKSTSACSFSAGQGTDLLQGSSINLNQPADCFSLNVNLQTTAWANISIVPPTKVFSTIVVQTTPVQISNPNILPAPLSQSIPTLPALYFALVISFAIISRKRIISRGKVKLASAIQVLSLEQLNMLRC